MSDPANEGARPPRVLILVAGTAGSGKTTLGRTVAAHLGVPIVDLDTVTCSLLDALWRAGLLADHWNGGSHRDLIREARYATLRDVISELFAVVDTVVAVAPFSAEVDGGESWHRLLATVPDGEVLLIWLAADETALRLRRQQRGEERDEHRPETQAPIPTVPHLRIDAALAPGAQLARVQQMLLHVLP
jgi:sugar-phosphatase